jgi:hypothetical protein
MINGTLSKVNEAWNDNVIIPNEQHFQDTNLNITRILNPHATSVEEKRCNKLLEEIYGN